MPSEDFPKKWQEIVTAAGDGKVTSKFVADSLGLPKKKRRGRKAKSSDGNEVIIELLASIRGALKEKNIEDASRLFAKLEKLFKI